jgi:CheY-like chemotaxis protein
LAQKSAMRASPVATSAGEKEHHAWTCPRGQAATHCALAKRCSCCLFTDQASARQQPPFGVLIAHPYQVVAEGLGVMLDAQDDLAVLGVAHDGHQAVELATKHEPTVLLLDAHMPGPDLATTLRAVRAASPATKVMMLSADTRRETIAEALAAGADGFLTKDASSRQVATAIRKLAYGKGSIVTAAESSRSCSCCCSSMCSAAPSPGPAASTCST